jgi:hypothetical protein
MQIIETVTRVARQEIEVGEGLRQLSEDLAWVVEDDSEMVAYKDWFSFSMLIAISFSNFD